MDVRNQVDFHDTVQALPTTTRALLFSHARREKHSIPGELKNTINTLHLLTSSIVACQLFDHCPSHDTKSVKESVHRSRKEEYVMNFLLLFIPFIFNCSVEAGFVIMYNTNVVLKKALIWVPKLSSILFVARGVEI